MNEHIKFCIPSEDYIILESLIGKPFSPVSFQEADKSYLPKEIIAHMVAVETEPGKYVQFDTDDWGDTNDFMLDCFRMRVRSTSNPVRFFYKVTRKPVECKIANILNPDAHIEHISIYKFNDEEMDKETEESVTYDAALLLNRIRSKPILICVDSSSIVGNILLIQNQKLIESKLEQYSLNKVIKKHGVR